MNFYFWANVKVEFFEKSNYFGLISITFKFSRQNDMQFSQNRHLTTSQILLNSSLVSLKLWKIQHFRFWILRNVPFSRKLVPTFWAEKFKWGQNHERKFDFWKKTLHSWKHWLQHCLAIKYLEQK